MIDKDFLNKLKTDFIDLKVTAIEQRKCAGISFPTLQRLYSGETYNEKAIDALIALRKKRLDKIKSYTKSL